MTRPYELPVAKYNEEDIIMTDKQLAVKCVQMVETILRR